LDDRSASNPQGWAKAYLRGKATHQIERKADEEIKSLAIGHVPILDRYQRNTGYRRARRMPQVVTDCDSHSVSGPTVTSVISDGQWFSTLFLFLLNY
jgi:hypothetical protein